MPRVRMVYDDDCGFCTWCARQGVRYADVEAVAFSDVTADVEARLPPHWRESAHLLTDDAVYSGGAAVERVFARMHPALSGAFRRLRRVPGYPWLRERLYEWAAAHRDWWGRIVSRDSL